MVEAESGTSSHAFTGAFTLSTSACKGANCSARLDSLRVTAPSIELGAYRFTDVEARLVAPVVGERQGDALAFVGNRMVFELEGRAASSDGHLKLEVAGVRSALTGEIHLYRFLSRPSCGLSVKATTFLRLGDTCRCFSGCPC